MTKNEEQDNPGQGLGRNDRCHCDSGKKYKQCCLGKDEAAARELRAKQAEAAAAEAEETSEASGDEPAEQQPRTKHEKTHQPWKRDSSSSPSVQRRTLPRKVGS